jgi:hypothetical protein
MMEVLKVVGVIAAAGACIWLYVKLLAFSDERGIRRRVRDPRVDPPKVEIQSLFHGNTKDEDQL